jgi:hypothetical protein
MRAEYLERLEMWCRKRIGKIKWSEKVTNEEILEYEGEKRMF